MSWVVRNARAYKQTFDQFNEEREKNESTHNSYLRAYFWRLFFYSNCSMIKLPNIDLMDFYIWLICFEWHRGKYLTNASLLSREIRTILISWRPRYIN